MDWMLYLKITGAVFATLWVIRLMFDVAGYCPWNARHTWEIAFWVMVFLAALIIAVAFILHGILAAVAALIAAAVYFVTRLVQGLMMS